MPRDDYGHEINDGDTIRFVVGIPGRSVVAKVRRDARGRLVADDGTASMALSFVLDFFDCEVIN